MRLTVRCVCTAVLFGLIAFACSSDKSSTDNTADGGDGGGAGKGTGGSGAGGKGTAGTGTAGKGSGGAPMACGVDAGSQGCDQCLASECCDDYKACQGDSTCIKALREQEACAAIPGADPSDCFGGFTRALGADGGINSTGTAIQSCVIFKCHSPCGGPGVV